MFFQALSRLGRGCSCNFNSNNGFRTVDFGCDLNDNACECGMLGCHCINRIRWINSNESTCDCDIESIVNLTNEGFSDWRRDAVATASRFLSNCAIPQCFRNSPAFLRDKTCFCGKTYVLLGFRCKCSIAFELCKICNDSDVWMVCRYAMVD